MEIERSTIVVAITITVAAILLAFYTGIIRLPSGGGERCSSSDFSIYDCTYNSTSHELNLTLWNDGQHELDAFDALVVYGGNKSKWILIMVTLKPNYIGYYSFDNIDPGFSKISVSARDCKNLVREASC
jgi:hypothetical protein